MRIKELKLRNFGPFREYTIPFVSEDSACLLLTGKNNEGKSSIIKALQLLDAATRVIDKSKQEIMHEGIFFYKLLVQDTENLSIGRMVHNYEASKAEIHGVFSDGFRLSVYLDPSEDLAYAERRGRVPNDIQQIFGFIPVLGPISEDEDIIAGIPYLCANMRTSLAPRHLRNYFYQILTDDEFQMVRDIIKSSWPGVELLDFTVDRMSNKLVCFFKEGRIEREISWAGQGLQVWFQIITHLVRLRNTAVLILDEPEINLHPEKQNDLIRIIRDYYSGSIMIATHSTELMNNVNVSHIINVKKRQKHPVIKSTANRAYLEVVRAEIGSNFNLIASQYEEFDLIIFTEDVSDYVIISELARAFKIRKKAFNIPLHGFSEHTKAAAYKNAYELLIGKNVDYTILLDRDYYPNKFLLKTKKALEAFVIRTIFTFGKEIENLFLAPSTLRRLIPGQDKNKFDEYLNTVFDDLYSDCYSSYISLHKQFLPRHLDTKTVVQKYTPKFNTAWNSKQRRYNIIAGKEAIKRIRTFYHGAYRENLTQSVLIDAVVATDTGQIRKFIEAIYHEGANIKQVLHY